MIKVVLIGISGFGAVYYNDLIRYHKAGKLEFTAATVINQDEMREKCAVMQNLGIRIYDDYHEMLNNEKADLCCIPTGISMHMPMSVAAMKAKMNVLMEKPVAATIEEVCAISRAESETGMFATVAYQDLYRPEIHELKHQLIAGVIGKIKEVTVSACSTSSKKYYQRNNWAGKLYCGERAVFDSPFNNGNAHQINLSFFLCGSNFLSSVKIEDIQGKLYRACKIESFDTGSVFAQGGGIDFFIVISKAASKNVPPKIRISGTTGEAVIMQNEIRVSNSTGEVFKRTMEQNSNRIRDNILESVIHKIEGIPGTFTVGMEIAGKHTAFINILHKKIAISDIPKRLIYEFDFGNTRQTAIKGIENMVSVCTRDRRLLSIIS